MLECNTQTQTEIAQTVYTVSEQVTLVGTVAVVSCDVQTRSVSPGIDIETDFR